MNDRRATVIAYILMESMYRIINSENELNREKGGFMHTDKNIHTHNGRPYVWI